MSDDMVERVAKAMWEIRRARAQTMGLHLEEWDDGHWPKANGIMEEARVAIEAMREPTEAMVEQFEWHKPQEAARFYWGWMVGAALGDSVTVELPEAQKTL